MASFRPFSSHDRASGRRLLVNESGLLCRPCFSQFLRAIDEHKNLAAVRGKIKPSLSDREFIILVSPGMCEAQTGFSVFQVTKRCKDGLPMLGIEQHASEKGVGKQEAGKYRFTTLLQSNKMESKPLFGRADKGKPWTVSALTDAAASEYTYVPPGVKGRSVRYVRLVDGAAQVQSTYEKMAVCRSNW